jgi:hypothetical protein
MPALPLDEAGKYVAGAYVVFVGLLLIYVAIMAVRIDRMRQELSELADLAESRQSPVASRQRADEIAEGERVEVSS